MVQSAAAQLQGDEAHRSMHRGAFPSNGFGHLGKSYRLKGKRNAECGEGGRNRSEMGRRKQLLNLGFCKSVAWLQRACIRPALKNIRFATDIIITRRESKSVHHAR
jgi:hypothetical protein